MDMRPRLADLLRFASLAWHYRRDGHAGGPSDGDRRPGRAGSPLPGPPGLYPSLCQAARAGAAPGPHCRPLSLVVTARAASEPESLTGGSDRVSLLAAAAQAQASGCRCTVAAEPVRPPARAGPAGRTRHHPMIIRALWPRHHDGPTQQSRCHTVTESPGPHRVRVQLEPPSLGTVTSLWN
jgi:hypothetical protein